jgi:tetratricopeptide (TPR) repeat protein
MAEEERATREARSEEERANREALSNAAYQIEKALAEAAAEQKKTISEAWRHQAQARTDRASELYNAGMYEEALQLLREAIHQDPGNIEPYIIASQVLESKDSILEARSYSEKQIALLNTTEYSHSPATFRSVLSCVRRILKSSARKCMLLRGF